MLASLIPIVLYPYSFFFFFFLMLRPPPISTLFPYTTLFRSNDPLHLPAVLADAACRERPERPGIVRSEEHTSELQSRENLVCRLLLEKKKKKLILLYLDYTIKYFLFNT